MLSTLRPWLLTACAVANLYLLGALVVFARVVYAQFASVPREGFAAYYAAFNPRIGLPFVLVEFLAFLTALPLLWARPEGVPAWAAWAMLAAGVAYFAITFGLHLPVHRALAAGDNSPDVMRALLASHAARTWVHAVKCAVIAWALVAATRR